MRRRFATGLALIIGVVVVGMAVVFALLQAA